MTFRCIAYACSAETEQLMCRSHWRLLSRHLKADIVRELRPGVPWSRASLEYRKAVHAAVADVWRAALEEDGRDVCRAGDFNTEDLMKARDEALRAEGGFLLPEKVGPDPSCTIAVAVVETENSLLTEALAAAITLRDAVEAQDMGFRLPSSMPNPPEPGSYRDLLKKFDAACARHKAWLARRK